MSEVVYLTRRNLLALLAKLDANVAEEGSSECAIIKYQMARVDSKYRQTMPALLVVALEDNEFYDDQQRSAGHMHPREEVNLPKPKTGVDFDLADWFEIHPPV